MSLLVPCEGEIDSEAPIYTAISRVEEIRANKFPLSFDCGSFNSKVLSVLGYVAKLIPTRPIHQEWHIQNAQQGQPDTHSRGGQLSPKTYVGPPNKQGS